LLCFLSFSTQGSFLSRDSWYSVQLVRAIFVVECLVGVDMFVVVFVVFFVLIMQKRGLGAPMLAFGGED
jgi:hypothetical protein